MKLCTKRLFTVNIFDKISIISRSKGHGPWDFVSCEPWYIKITNSKIKTFASQGEKDVLKGKGSMIHKYKISSYFQ